MTPAFSIEMQSKKQVKHMSVCCECNSTRGVLFEGDLGRLKELSMIEGAVLEIKGTNGVLRIDLQEDELKRMLSEKRTDEQLKDPKMMDAVKAVVKQE